MAPFRAELRADIAALNDRLSQLGFRAAGILAAGLIALVATQLSAVGASRGQRGLCAVSWKGLSGPT